MQERGIMAKHWWRRIFSTPTQTQVMQAQSFAQVSQQQASVHNQGTPQRTEDDGFQAVRAPQAGSQPPEEGEHGSIVPPYARTWWFFPTSSSKIPQENIDNVIDFCKKNPQVETSFVTNDIQKIKDALPAMVPANLQVEHIDNHLPQKSFPLVQKLAKR